MFFAAGFHVLGGFALPGAPAAVPGSADTAFAAAYVAAAAADGLRS